MTQTSAWDKFLLLSWKNWLIQFRHPIQTALEILIPVMVCAFLILIRSLVDVTVQEDPIFFDPIKMEWIDEQSFADMTRGISSNTEAPNPHVMAIGYSPFNPFLTQVMARAALKTGMVFTPLPFNSSAELESMAVGANFFINFEFDDSLAGNVALPSDIHYAVRFPAELRRSDSLPNDLGGFSENWSTNIRFGRDFLPGPRNSVADDGGQPPGYIRQGFTMFQNIVERELIRQFAGNPLLNFPELHVQRYPFPEYVNDILGLILEFAIPLIFMIAFLYSAVNNIKYIAIEKELQLKEAMKIMGLSGYLHWLAWFTKCMLFQIIVISIITGLVKIPFASQEGLAVFTHTHWSVLWVFFFLYALAGVTFSFMMSTFFAKANIAAIAGAVAWLFMLNPYSIININYDSVGIWPKIAASLLVNSGMGFGFKVLGRYESAMVGVQWHNLFTPFSPDDDMTLGYVMLALLTASFIQMILALYIEKVKPGDFGVPEPWYFPVSPRFWKGSAKSYANVDAIPMTKNSNFEEEPTDKNPGIKIRGLRKVYGNKVAVNDLHLNIYEDEITVLLGHNGAGKSTTMGMLTGLLAPSQGTALINGYDIRGDLNKVRGSLGLCPQHNVLFNELTVREHIIFFAKLKGIKEKSAIDEQIKKYVDILELQPKINAQSHTLSGGMKRKLSIGIALCGNSKIVMCDEPSSGMDPSARRALWDLLIQEKQGRTILLTTHFMDEADILGDRIAIMADGDLKTVGTSFFLKKRFGVGYRLTLVKKQLCNPNDVTEFLARYIPNITFESNIGTELSYILPEDKTRIFKLIFKDLEDNLDMLKISSFGLSLTTMEEVFLKVGTDSLVINEEIELPSNGSSKGVNGINGNGTMNGESSINLLERDLVYGSRLAFNQTLAMFMKKFYYTIRNYVMLIIMFLIPILFLVITMAFESFLGGFENLPELRISFLEYLGTVTVYENNSTDSTMQNIIDNYRAFISDLPDEHSLRTTAPGLSLEETILAEYRESVSNVNLNYMVGTTFQDNSIIAWFNNQAFHTVPLTVNLINNAILRSIMGSDFKISLSNKPLPFSITTSFTQLQAGNNLGFNLALNTGFSFALVTACFVLFYIKERITKAKLLQIVSGANKVIFWTVAFIFDYGIYFLIMIVYVLATAAYQKDGFSTFEELSRITIILLAFGLAVLPFTYVLSFAFKVPTTGLVSLSIGYIVSGTLFYTIYFTLNSDLLDLKWISEPLGWTFLLFPHYSLTRAFSNLNIMQTTIAVCDRNCRTFNIGDNCEPICRDENCRDSFPSLLCDVRDACCARDFFSFKESAAGIMVTALIAVAILSFFVLFILEFKVFRTFINYLRNRKVPKNIPESEDGYLDSDVAEEKKKLGMFAPYYIAKNNLVVKDLSKFYGNFMAVNQLSVGVDKGECFGLLGVNGAGKTSTFKMLTGDENISSGDAWVDGMSIRNELNKVHKRIGYCPQFDALIDDLTGRETIKIFSLLRGVPRKDINAVAIQLAEDLNFMKHLDKKTKEYSGGNKRKLSTALTLIGDPSVIYLDEPTSGMDVGARRQLWNMVIKTRNSGKSVVLTSHSMEECEVLCNRLAIMVNGEFKCLGSVQHLKNKFSKGFFLTIKAGHDTNVQRLQDKLAIVKDFVDRAFTGAVLKEEYMDILTYHITTTNIKWSTIFGIMEDAKESLNILDYSLGQTSLEQIFLFFTKYQRISGKKTD